MEYDLSGLFEVSYEKAYERLQEVFDGIQQDQQLDNLQLMRIVEGWWFC